MKRAHVDFAWSEIALIGVVALVLIGPKDLPVAIKAVTGMVKKARRMAAEFQTHVDDMVKDADLHEVRDQIREIRSLDLRGTIARAVDKDGSIRSALSDPIRTPPPVGAGLAEPQDVDVAERPAHSIAMPPPAGGAAPAPAALPQAPPAFIPPAFIPPEAAAPVRTTPAFVPPDAVLPPLL